MMTIIPFTSEHVDGAYRLIRRIAATDKNLCIRPKEALRRAAARPDGGMVSLQNGKVCGLTVLYDTANSEYKECGSVSVAPEHRHKGLAPAMVIVSLLAFYAREENIDKMVFADVYATNPQTIALFEALGFSRFEAPNWIIQARGLKESQEQSQVETICLSINANAVPHLQHLYSDMPRIRAA